MGSTTRHSLATVSSVLVLILIWKLLSLMIGAEIILPAPESTVRDLLSVVRSPDFWPSVGATVARGLIGFLVSCLGGIAVGLLAGFNSLAFWMLQPLLTVIRSTPVMAVILLALIWFQTEMVPIFVSFLMAFPIMCSNTIEGIRNVDAQLVEMARLFRVSPRRVLWELYLPSVLPFLMAGASAAMGLTWKVIIAAEILSQPRLAIGTEMQTAKTYLDTVRVFSWTIVIITVSFVFETAMQAAEKHFRAWR